MATGSILHLLQDLALPLSFPVLMEHVDVMAISSGTTEVKVVYVARINEEGWDLTIKLYALKSSGLTFDGLACSIDDVDGSHPTGSPAVLYFKEGPSSGSFRVWTVSTSLVGDLCDPNIIFQTDRPEHMPEHDPYANLRAVQLN